MHYVITAAMLAAIGFGVPAWAYEEIAVTDGGSLSGTLSLEGQVPRPKGYNLITLPDQVYCGRISDGQGWRLLQPFNVGPAGQFRDVVVYLENIEMRVCQACGAEPSASVAVAPSGSCCTPAGSAPWSCA